MELSNLTKEQLMELLGSGASKKQSRKKTILDDAKKEAMLLKLADMRKTVAENRLKKKEATKDLPAPTPATLNVAFEKEYSSKLDKMTDLLNDLNENTKEISRLKKEKLKNKEASAVKEVVPPPSVQPPIKEVAIPIKEVSAVKEVAIIQPPQKPSNFIPMYEAPKIPSQADVLNPPMPQKIKPSREMFRKNQLW